jgi:Arc/MetJ-type ribon-helix-helix transcriptional regulator
MASATTTFRLSYEDRRILDNLADRLLCSRSDVLRYALAALQDEPGRLDRIRSENRARVFVQNLRTQYGADAVLEVRDADPADIANWKVAGDPIDPEFLNVAVTQQGDRHVLDLVDPASKVRILNVDSWTDADGRRHAVIPLRRLWFTVSPGTTEVPQTRQLLDGRTVVRIADDDGAVRYLVIDGDGNSRRLGEDEVPIAAFGERGIAPSIGVGLRRESIFGPHVGPGYGGQYQLTGDLQEDREMVIKLVTNLLERARDGGIDSLIALSEGTPRWSIDQH